MTARECHRCPHDGKRSQACLSCFGGETYDYGRKNYVLQSFDPPEPETEGSEPVTAFPEDAEDGMRRFLFDLFDLRPLELLTLRGIMLGKSLNEIGLDLTSEIGLAAARIEASPARRLSRHHVFQLRKSMLAKLGGRFAAALLTKGQKRPLKGPPPPSLPTMEGRAVCSRLRRVSRS